MTLNPRWDAGLSQRNTDDAPYYAYDTHMPDRPVLSDLARSGKMRSKGRKKPIESIAMIFR